MQSAKRGWYAEDGHPFTPGPITEQPVTIGGGNPDGFDGAVFNAFWRCQRCRALLERDDAELDGHRRHHSEVDEGLAIAWRLVNGKDVA